MNESKQVVYKTEHHKMPTSRGGVDDEPNREPLNERVHVALHDLFGNQHTIEKVKSIIGLDSRILVDKYRYVLMDLLGVDPTDVFVTKAFKDEESFRNVGETEPIHYGVKSIKKKGKVKNQFLEKRKASKLVLFGDGGDTLEKMKLIVKMDAIILTKHFKKEILKVLDFKERNVFSKQYLKSKEDYEWWGNH